MDLVRRQFAAIVGLPGLAAENQTAAEAVMREAEVRLGAIASSPGAGTPAAVKLFVEQAEGFCARMAAIAGRPGLSSASESGTRATTTIVDPPARGPVL